MQKFRDKLTHTTFILHIKRHVNKEIQMFHKDVFKHSSGDSKYKRFCY